MFQVPKNLALAMEESKVDYFFTFNLDEDKKIMMMLVDTKVSEEKKTKTHHIAADINNIVIVLLRYKLVHCCHYKLVHCCQYKLVHCCQYKLVHCCLYKLVHCCHYKWTLFRMEEMQKRLPEIMQQNPDTNNDDSEADPEVALVDNMNSNEEAQIEMDNGI